MTADWVYKSRRALPRPKKWGIDNLVHEIFKCLEEVALHKAYVIEQVDGSLKGFNCSVLKKGNTLVITPNNPRVDSVHLNFKGEQKVEVRFKDAVKRMTFKDKLGWVRK